MLVLMFLVLFIFFIVFGLYNLVYYFYDEVLCFYGIRLFFATFITHFSLMLLILGILAYVISPNLFWNKFVGLPISKELFQ